MNDNNNNNETIDDYKQKVGMIVNDLQFSLSEYKIIFNVLNRLKIQQQTKMHLSFLLDSEYKHLSDQELLKKLGNNQQAQILLAQFSKVSIQTVVAWYYGHRKMPQLWRYLIYFILEAEKALIN